MKTDMPVSEAFYDKWRTVAVDMHVNVVGRMQKRLGCKYRTIENYF